MFFVLLIAIGESKKHLSKKHIGIILCAIVILTVMYVVFFNSGSEDYDLIEAINNEAISANILIIIVTEESDSVSFSAGLSGVIFRKGPEKYYVLTALHGIPFENELNDMKFLVLGYDQPTYGETDIVIGQKSYYSQFPEAVLEYYDEAYDLAVVSFNCENEFAVLSIASEQPNYNEPVAAIGNPWGNARNTVTTGKVTSKKPVPFGDKIGANQHNVIEHSARTSVGISGGALLNKKNMEIVGINLGAGENIFRQFVKGKAMPCDKILEFLSVMDNY